MNVWTVLVYDVPLWLAEGVLFGLALIHIMCGGKR